MDLSNYVRVGQYNLPEPTRTAAPSGNLLAQEASAVTYDWDTETLFVLGDGGTSIVQISKTGQLINSMTLAAGSSPQGTAFYDPEGLAYIGNGQFVMTEERDRNAVLFTYAANTTLDRSGAQIAHLGTSVGNIGLEGVTYDPQTGGYIFVKETGPQGIFQTTIDFATDTASNGSATTVNSVNLFDPALVGTLDFADVYALSNLSSLAGTADASHLLVLSQESGKIVEMDRAGNVISSLTIQSDPGNPLSLASQQHEGLTMDNNGFLYVVSENGGGDFDHPQLWVYALSTGTNVAPTGITLNNAAASVLENTSTAVHLKVADIAVSDDGLGTNTFSVSGTDAAFFDADATGLYVKAGTVLDYETKASYSVTVNVDDTTVGNTPDASTAYTLNLTNVVNEGIGGPHLIISEAAPWSSGNSPANVAADWFEVTNTGSAAIDITGWKMDDNSNSFASSVALTGITSIGAGESVIFIETGDSAVVNAFKALWFGTSVPAGLQVGTYSGLGVGLSTRGDAVNLFNAAGVLQVNVTFGAADNAAPWQTFDNAAGVNNGAISLLSSNGVNGAFTVTTLSSGSETGSPGSIGGVVAPTNAAPTALNLNGEVTSLAESASTATHIKVASVLVTDDGLGTNTLSVSGADAAYFEVDSTGLYIKAGTVLDFETKVNYAVTVNVDDTTVGATPDASINFSLNLTNVNETPALTGTQAVLANGTEDTSYLVSAAQLLSGFSDVDGDTLSVSGLSVTNGTVVDNLNATYTVTPNANVNGAQTLSYSVLDGNGGSTPATLGFTLTAVNDAPTGTATATLAAGTEDTAYLVSAANLLAGFSDVDGDSLSVSGLSVTNGTVVDNLDGTYTVTPDANVNGAQTLSYSVLDGNGGSIAATLGFTLDAVNDAPTGTATATLVAGAEDTAYIVSAADLLAGFSDVDGDSLSVSGLAVTNGTVVDNLDGTYTVTPNANVNGAQTLSYTVLDGNGGSTPATLGFTLAAVNDAPTAIALSNTTIAENTNNNTVVGTLSTTDVDNASGFTYQLLDNAGGAFSLNTATRKIFVSNGNLLNFEVATSKSITVQTTDAAGATFQQQISINLTNVVENQTYTGTSAADTFTASSDDNWTVDAKGGNDTITTANGADLIYGGNGNDVIATGGGNDTIVFTGNAGGLDVIDAGTGNDTVIANAANTTIGLSSIAGVETVTSGGFANVKIMGTAAADSFDFSGTTLAGIVSISGGAGNDQIVGSAGDDRISGGAGADTLTGGGGADSFAYALISESGIGVKADHILDFVAGVDQLDLGAIDANNTLAGNQAFTFIGADDFTALGQVRIGMSSGYVVIQANTGGNLAADFSIVLDSNPVLTVGDFIL